MNRPAEPDQTQSSGSNSATCAECGAKLSAELSVGLCPKCLFGAGLRTEIPACRAVETVNQAGPGGKGLPGPGDNFGHYRIIRILGQGGMGVVFEAEDLENGRRLALKLLHQELDSPEARKRFLREGQLAASLNHPHSVYVFGTEEICGIPVIAMELMPGGTLRDRVAADGPLGAGEAVDCILQMISGLEAAERAGILHRDIKPSNCFVTADGTVKIGDFGLSVGTQVRTSPDPSTEDGLFGTPAFSAPEQLRGERLSIRSDIYAVGATLFYLLSGITPVAGETVSQILKNMERGVPKLLETACDTVPSDLLRVVFRCLAPHPANRYESYSRLEKAFQQCSLQFDAPPASLSRRFLAGLFDLSFLVPACYLLSGFVSRKDWVSGTVFYGIIFSYFGVTEGIWGTSLGKILLRLRVVKPGGKPPGVPRALARAGLCVGLSLLVSDLICNSIQTIGGSEGLLVGFFLASTFVLIAGLFSTARKRNGFSALHDLITRTRVVSATGATRRWAARSREPKNIAAAESQAQEVTRAIGPYELVGDSDLDGGILLARDPKLMRQVWIRVLPIGAPPLPAGLRDLARPGRLRWLNGKRSSTEAWDAYEAAAGKPLIEVCRSRQEWAIVREWLLDLAEELKSSSADGSLPDVVALDRVWIGADGRAILLDFPVPGMVQRSSNAPYGSNEVPQSVTGFLNEVATCALQGTCSPSDPKPTAKPLPLHATAFLKELPELAGAAAVVERLKPLLSNPSSITRQDRLALVAGCLWLPVILTTSVAAMGETHPLPWMIGLGWLYGMIVVVAPALVAAVGFRGGALLHGIGAVVVRRGGAPASRGRVFWRSILAWTPYLVLGGIASILGMAYLQFRPDPGLLWLGGGLLLLLVALAIVSILLPTRSLQDRLAGTFLVPK